MGVECYTVSLRPQPNTVGPTLAETEAALQNQAFLLAPLHTGYGPGVLAVPPRGETEYLWRTANGVVEAMTRWEGMSPQSSRPDNLTVQEIVLRFAVCQPPDAEDHFYSTVRALTEEFPLSIHEGYRGQTYSSFAFDAYRTESEPDLRALQRNWRRLFGGDSERVAVTTDEAWAHFLNRYPDALQKKTG